MTEPTRRNFLIAGGAGAAAAGVVAAVPSVAGAQTRSSAPTALPHDATALVAHVADPATGTVTLFVGEREVLVHDSELVARLARAASKEQ